jgi:hypothetical protein
MGLFLFQKLLPALIRAKIIFLSRIARFECIFLRQISIADFISDHQARWTFGNSGSTPLVQSLKKTIKPIDDIDEEAIQNDFEK